MKILVTGAGGRLGSCVCRLLQEQGIAFRAVDKVVNDSIEFPVDVADLLDWYRCNRLLEDVDVLMHFANHPNWDSSNPEQVYIDNAKMNMNLFQSAANQGCSRIVFSSSVQVLDGQLPIKDRLKHPIYLPYLPMDSDMPAIPRNSYGLSKEAAERALHYFSETMGMTCVVIRYPLMVDSLMLKLMMDNGGMIRGNPYDGFTYLPVYSGAEAAVLAATAELEGYRSYFVASKDNMEQRPTAEVIKEGLSHLPFKQPIESLESLVDCSKVEKELRWSQPKSLKESYERYREFKEMRPYG